MEGVELARFMAKVEKQDGGCWLWIGAQGGKGEHRYGVFRAGGNFTTAHRHAYAHWVGTLVEGDRSVTIDHTCGVKLCVNPEHLRQVAHGENLLASDRTVNSINKAKKYCINGHKFTANNTYVHPRTGMRSCRQCKREWAQRNRKEEP